jgi:hypothetical protein
VRGGETSPPGSLARHGRRALPDLGARSSGGPIGEVDPRGAAPSGEGTDEIYEADEQYEPLYEPARNHPLALGASREL